MTTNPIAAHALAMEKARADAANAQLARAVALSVDEGLITVSEAASILRTSRSQVYRMIERYRSSEP